MTFQVGYRWFLAGAFVSVLACWQLGAWRNPVIVVAADSLGAAEAIGCR